MPLANVNLLHALQKILEGVDELGFGALEGDKPCTMGVFLRDVCKTDLTAGSYCHDYFSIIPIVNDKYGPCEDNRNRRIRMLAWVKERLRAEDGRGYRTSLSEQEIQEMTIMPLRNIPYSFTFNYRRQYV